MPNAECLTPALEDETPFHTHTEPEFQARKKRMSEDAYPQCKQLKRPSHTDA